MHRKLLPIAIVCLWLLIMFSLSTSIGGADNTEYVLEASLRKLSMVLPLNVSSYTVGFLNVILRKSAHFTEYAILMGLGYWLSTRSLHLKSIPGLLVTLTFVVILALSDEFHQSFVPGRTPLFTDALIDTSGAVVSAMLLWWFDVKPKLRRKS